ncbi:MAG: carbohydrate kinase family protein [Candidatus Marinimicrobia bacterium]|nr:carbohydrate kinase family protein [Candidatus Neomarinimicrobiota bacterium]
MDYLYHEVDFSGAAFARYQARQPGCGGLTPGALVFAEHLEAYAGQPLENILRDLTGGAPPRAQNLGGPNVVALIHAAQLLAGADVRFELYGAHGADDAAAEMQAIIGQTPLAPAGYLELPGRSPLTLVLADPQHDHGAGERTFINLLGVAADYGPEHLPDEFFAADVLYFGGTALTPRLHAALTDILRRGRERGALNIVATVYDFFNERRAPDKPWPLGSGPESYALIDLLICDAVEALRLSGQRNADDALDYFLAAGVGGVVITSGPEPVYLAARGGPFLGRAPTRLPISEAIRRELAALERPPGDTTGCGDNFAGGVLYALLCQWQAQGRADWDLAAACAWGVCSGGLACFYPGGVMLERAPGEKLARVAAYHEAYLAQMADIR